MYDVIYGIIATECFQTLPTCELSINAIEKSEKHLNLVRPRLKSDFGRFR